MVKRAAEQLINQNSDKFSDSFEYNKRILGGTMPSKPIRNKIAGYLARLIQMQKKEAAKLATK